MNKKLGLLGILLMAVVVTTYSVGGTYAKYVSALDRKTDKATVAKFGVKIEGDNAKDPLFSTERVVDSKNVVLSSSATTNVVAPGMSSTGTGTVTVSGKSEVAVKVSSSFDIDLGDNWMIAADDDENTDDIFYCPLVFTVGTTTIKGYEYTSAALLEKAIEDAMAFEAKEYEAGETINDEVKGISWAWDMEAVAGSIVKTDANDTKLGEAATKATITIDFDVKVEQIESLTA